MHEGICEILLENGVQLFYGVNRLVERALRKMAAGLPAFHCETSINEKVALELAVTASWASKRTACLVSSEGLYEALDPLMSCVYTGVVGGCLIVAVQENDEEVTPLGPFSKIPVMVTEDGEEFRKAVEFGYYISEKYGIPVIIQAQPFQKNKASGPMPDAKDGGSETGKHAREGRAAYFERLPGRWAATPQFRYELHKLLNDKIEKIRSEFELYEGNRKIIRGDTGLITDRSFRVQFYDDEISLLKLATVHPLPVKLVGDFIDGMNMVFVSETYPAMELQIPERAKVKKGLSAMPHRGPKPEETIYGFHVVRDKLGSASAINMAHGIKKAMPHLKVLAVTYEDHFFHSGMPAFVNTLYNASSYALLIVSNEREAEIMKILDGFGFHNYFHIDAFSEVERFNAAEELTVLFCKGIV